MSTDVVEDFYGVYILICKNPRFKGRTYIGFTVDPGRRVKQHNGVKSGGAYKTSNKGPWEMVLIVHGFPNDISALRFEWAWQNPHKSRRLRLLQPKKKNNESKFDYCLHILVLMLQTNPWNRLPLTVRWLKEEYAQDFLPGMEPPVHIPVAFGAVKPLKIKQVSLEAQNTRNLLKDCTICHKSSTEVTLLKCLSKSCSMTAHAVCLAKEMLKSDPFSVIPIEGPCPKCDHTLLWGDIVRLKKGCYQENYDSEEENNHWTQSLTQESRTSAGRPNFPTKPL